MAEDLDKYPDRVADTIRGKTIFITGGTGFVGKVLVEKLLRCFDPARIYLLIREKKGKDPKERIKIVFENPLFDTVRTLKGEEIFDKCLPICGDVGAIDLALSKEDRETLINETEIVYHGAATIRFDDPLKKAILLNVRGVKYMLELAKEMKKLKAYIHISTSYCHLGEKVLYEKAYPPATDPHHLIKGVEWMNEEVVDAMTPKLLGDMPNTYAFTKNLAEALCAEQIEKIPIIVVRPSVVVPVWIEPIPGWTDNINGPTGLLIAAGKGVLRTMYCKQDGYADFVPVDIVANSLVCVLYDLIYNGRVRRFYNVCSSYEYKVTWEEVINIGRKVVYERMPLNGVAWYPGGSMKSSRLWRVQQRITKGFDVLEYYANHQWDFNTDESMKGRELLNPRERALYKLDGSGIDYVDYFTHCTHAARLYILKETDDTIPAARRHMNVMYWVDVITKLLLCLLLLNLLYKYVFSPILGVL